MTHTIPGPPPGAAPRSDVLAVLLLRDMEPEDDVDEDGDVEEEAEDEEGMLALELGELLDLELPVVPEPVLALPAVELPLLALLEEPPLLELPSPDFDLSTPP